MTDRIDILTKARDALTEYLHEVDDQNVDAVLSRSISDNEANSSNEQDQHSPLDKNGHQQKSWTPSNPSKPKDITVNDYSTGGNDPANHPYYYSLPSPVLTQIASQQSMASNQRSRSPSMTPSNFIRVHFPNKHTTAVSLLILQWLVLHVYPFEPLSWHHGTMRHWQSPLNHVPRDIRLRT